MPFRARSGRKAEWRELCRIIRHFGSGMIRPFAQNIWDLRPRVSVEFSRGQHGNAWAPPNTLGRILARVLHAETARMARCPLLARILHAETTTRTACCPFARPKTAKTKNSGANCPRTGVRVPARDQKRNDSRVTLSSSRNAVNFSSGRTMKR
jgi:hypothetical protein